MTHKNETFFKWLADPNKTDKKFALVSGEMLVMYWKDKDFSVKSEKKGSLVHAIFTTSLARIHLYRSLLHPLGRRVLYCDTDSAVFLSGDNHPPDPPLGKYLGQLTDELDDGHVVAKWVCGGPKNYGYVSYNLKEKDEEGRSLDITAEKNHKKEFKCKGVVNTINAQEVNFDVVRDALLSCCCLKDSEDDADIPHQRMKVYKNRLPADPISSFSYFQITRNLGRDPETNFTTEDVFGLIF